MGVNALTANTTGVDNTAIGYNAIAAIQQVLIIPQLVTMHLL